MRNQALEKIAIDALADRLLRPERLRELLANLLDDSSAAVRERQAQLQALRTERARVEGAIQNMLDSIEQGSSVSATPISPVASLPSAAGAPISNPKSCWSNASSRPPTAGFRPKPSNGSVR